MKRLSTTFFLAALSCAVLAPTAMAQGLRVSPQHLANYWLLTTQSVDADVPNTGRGLDKPGCVAVSYTIGADGVTRDIQVRKVVPATSDLGSIAVSVIRQYRYASTPDNSAQRPVSTYYIVPFNLAKTRDGGKQLTQSCALRGY